MYLCKKQGCVKKLNNPNNLTLNSQPYKWFWYYTTWLEYKLSFRYSEFINQLYNLIVWVTTMYDSTNPKFHELFWPTCISFTCIVCLFLISPIICWVIPVSSICMIWVFPIYSTSIKKNTESSVIFLRNDVLDGKENKEATAICFEIRIPKKKSKELLRKVPSKIYEVIL